MECRRVVPLAFAISAIFAVASARAVNISNTWMLPEEGFPVFYRYFRDRISWYEADAVCQFHHANLVTADSTSQYDAIRAYLKELDIADNVWIGLSKSTEKPNFTWTDFRPMNGDGHWQEAIPVGVDPKCVAMDPAADFLWKALPCGGPEVAAFICELPVPSWAQGPRGCLLTELPSLTVLYIPEQSALELTSDCGLDGTKRIACKGNADREEILKQLTCAIPHEDFEDKSTKSSIVSSTPFDASSSEENSLNSKTTKPWLWTSNTIDIDYGMPTRHRRETEDTLSPISTKSTTDLSTKESGRGGFTTESLISSSTFPSPSFETEVTSVSPEGDSTLDSSVSRQSDKSVELTTTQTAESTTQDSNTQPEEQAETATSATATAEAKVAETAPAIDDTADEYPSAINQGQLFSIIENGTMFDIIELNETGTDDLKLRDITDSDDSKIKNISYSPPSSTSTSTTTKKPQTTNVPMENLYTTVVYNKEPPSDATFVTNKSLKNKDKQNKKDTLKDSDPKKANYPSPKANNKNKAKNNNAIDQVVSVTDKSLNKEVEMFPIVSDGSEKLNRTDRKEVPTVESQTLEDDLLDKGSKFGSPRFINFSLNNDINNEHQHIEIKLHEEGKNNITQSFFVTTKRSEKPTTSKLVDDGDKEKIETPVSPAPENIETLPVTNKTNSVVKNVDKIDPKIDQLNANITEKNKDSETFVPTKEKKIEILPKDSEIMKKQFLPKSLLGEDESMDTTTFETATINEEGVSSQDPLEPEPEAQPRPNRQRQLTRPQRRSFYPYFFSRVLG